MLLEGLFKEDIPSELIYRKSSESWVEYRSVNETGTISKQQMVWIGKPGFAIRSARLQDVTRQEDL
jgi:hypothetical protein